VVAVGIGVHGADLTAGLAVTAVLGLALAAALWWLYFDGEDERAEAALRAASDERNPWLALFAFGYCFLLVLGGVIVLAAGVKQAVVRYDEPATAATAWFLGAGVAVYAVGLTVLRWTLRLGPVGARVAVAVAALATVPLGLATAAEVQIGALTAVVVGAIVVEHH
jgi:low temperature requirement protein LtrA